MANWWDNTALNLPPLPGSGQDGFIPPSVTDLLSPNIDFFDQYYGRNANTPPVTLPSASPYGDYAQLIEANRKAQEEAARIDREFQQNSANAAMQFEADQAQLDRDWQASANQIAMDFSSKEAQLQRNWIDASRANAYEVAVEGMKRAGLNPILAASGNGAPVVSGSVGSGYTSGGSAARGHAASGSKSDVDIQSYNSLVNTMVSAAARVYGDTVRSIADIIPG